METTLKTRLLTTIKTTILLLSIPPALFWLARLGYSLEWTGFGAPVEAGNQLKTLWNWMELLLLPAILAAAVILVNRSRQESERSRVEGRTVLEREIARDGQQEQAFQAYVDRMAEHLLKDKLSRFSTEEVRNVARIRTLTVLRGLDARRKGSVLLFLKDSSLIDREAVIDLCGADLRRVHLPSARMNRVNLGEADLSGADLSGADLSKSYLGGTRLYGADLTGADLSGADLFEADLNGADLTGARLTKANLAGADLRGCRLNQADLSGADLQGVNLNVGDLVGASLRGAKLGGARLVGADLRQADLSQADLSGTDIPPSELEKVKSLEGATLPDGSKHA